MSAIIGRVILAVGIGVVAALVYSYKNRREQHSHRDGRGGRGRAGGYQDSDNRNRTWGRGDYPDDDDGRPCTRRKPSSASRTETKEDEVETCKESTSVVASCPICCESFQDLKRKGVSIFTTPCGHLFCEKCLKQAVGTSQICPICRIHVQFRNCHRIFL